MKEKLRIRLAQISDYTMLANLGRKAFYEAFGEFNDAADMQAYLDLAFNPEAIKLQLQDPDITYLVADLGNEPVGYAKLKRNSAPPELKDVNCIQLERIYTLKAFFGKHVGKALMIECIEIAKREKRKSIWLSVWQENKRAIDFYLLWKFKVIGFKQFVIGNEVNDDFVMAKNLDEL
ncbi:MAG: GNAT family N-acetyltransferase [Bacteroidetes bacterium]|nr:GNAT family N-acetyltransferase [Bacteroidota bacterium]